MERVSPKLTVPERRAGRVRGKSDPIDALAVARAALREPDLPRPQPGERVHREIKLLVDHRDDLVDERRRTQQRLRWHLHELDPTLVVPLRRLDRASTSSASAAGWPGGSRTCRCGSPGGSLLADAGDRRARPGTRTAGGGCRAGAARPAGLRRDHGGEAAGRDRDDQPLQKQTRNWPATAASHHWSKLRERTNVTDSTAAPAPSSTH